MFKKKFKIWLTDLLPNMTLITIDIYIIKLGYLENGPPCFTKLLDDNKEKLNKILIELDTATVILKTDNQDLLDLINSKVK